MWMDPVEQSQLFAIIHSVAPRRVLEWGAGGSTRHILERCAFIERYVSIEYNQEWYERVRDAIKDPRLVLEFVPPDVPAPDVKPRHPAMMAWLKKAETDPSLFATYVARARELGPEFDFILVDGRARCSCFVAGHSMLRPGGVLVVHDAQRSLYHATLASLGKPVYFEPWKQGQIAMLRKDG